MQKAKNESDYKNAINRVFPGDENSSLIDNLMGCITEEVQLGFKARETLSQYFIFLDKDAKEQIKDQELYRILSNKGGSESPRARLEREVTGKRKL